jgi:hypothetical protein
MPLLKLLPSYKPSVAAGQGMVRQGKIMKGGRYERCYTNDKGIEADTGL